jgi:hypothetical protein
VIANKPLKTLQLGDLFEIRTSQGLFYIQYCNFHERLGYLLRKIEEPVSQQEIHIGKLCQSDTEYRFFYPLNGAIQQKYVRRIGNCELRPEDRALPVFTNPIDKVIIGL